MKRIETEINYQATKELLSSNLKLYIAFIVLGLALIGLYLGLGLGLNFLTEFWNIIIMAVGIVFTVFGFIYIFTLRKTLNNSKDVHIKLKYEFGPKELKVSTYNQASKSYNNLIIAYKDIKNYKESEHYLFLYVSLTKAFPLPKDESLEEIKEIINIKSIRKRL